MDKIFFLKAMKAAMEKQVVEWEEPISAEEWQMFFRLASEQNVVSLIANSVLPSRAYINSGAPFVQEIRGRVRQEVITQIRKTEEFLGLYRHLSEHGLEPIVVKGIICRNLYPNPDSRISGDEDLYIPEGAYELYHKALLEGGMEVASWDVPNVDILHEISYVKKNGVLRIELHKDLFETESKAYANMNERFADVFANSIQMEQNGVQIRTMNHSDHLLFLIMHIFKHFINSGVGIRQVCDIAMYANAYGAQIDWKFVLDECKKVNADVFAAALFDIGHRYLGLDFERACYPMFWEELHVDSEDLLDDILAAGVFGGSDMDRKHSGSITLNAVASKVDGESQNQKSNILKTIFPSRKTLENRYQYLQKYPFLLPIAWISRIVRYSKTDNNAMESIKLGNQRIDLLKKYKIM